MKDNIILFCILAGIPLFIVFSLLIMPLIECRSYGVNSSKDWKYSYISGCYIKSGESFVPLAKWRNAEVVK